MALMERESQSRPSHLIWSIQAADWRDYTQLKQLEKSCFDSMDVWPFWDLFGILTLPGMVRLKAVAEGRMIGFLGGERRTAQNIGWVTTLAVLPDCRRQGIAMALLADGEAALAMPVVRLSVRASNHAAISLYKFAGYAQVDRWARYYAGGEDALVFEKRC